MRSVVTGLMMLAGAVVREKGHGIRRFRVAAGGAKQAREAQEADAATSGNVRARAAREEVDGGGPSQHGRGGGRAADRDRRSLARRADERHRRPRTTDAAPGDWDVACEREAGDRLVFDRDSLREMGGGTLVPLGADRRRRAERRRHDLHGGRRLPREEHRGELAGQAERDARRHLRTSSGRRGLRRARRRQGAQAGPGSARAPARRRRRSERQRDAVGDRSRGGALWPAGRAWRLVRAILRA